ncbi:hypothetical protein DIURU_002330 [Diutina rugosa]|uniref:N-terminal acetyltransferase B complex subunit MDM20 n=1 Tax=Diutina rugosa TaxID=5481 RepID=A0A642UQL4_DIURU|nr:uncharacterized protein DIURU_002330 [Diutina rugosa]KAA8903444.1 hypothetical protein DIURU_002330 [Diutina rugosa]
MDDDLVDLIDQGQYSHAQQALAQRIKRFPNRPYYPALQNLCLFRQGQQKDAVTKMLKLRDSNPNCTKTIGVMYDFFVEAGKLSEANLCYENAMKRYPTAESLGTTWLNKTLTTHQYSPRLWNRIFMNLQRNQKSSREFKYWTAFTYLLILKSGDATEKEIPLFKQLALRLIEDLGYENAQELYVLAQLWAMNGETDKVVAAVTSSPVNFDVMVVYRNILQEANADQQLFDYCKLILSQFEDFTSTKLLIESGKKLGMSYDEVAEHLDSKPTRNNLLAKVELAKVFDKPLDPAVQQYFNAMKSKLCCVNDLKGYKIHPKFEEKSSNVVAQVNEVKFKYLAGEKFDDVAEELSKSLSAKSVEYDSDPVNEVRLLKVILDLQKDSTPQNIIKNICILEDLVETDKYNHKLLLWLLKLYNQLNCGSSIQYFYTRLSIRMVQHETLGHLAMWAQPSKDSCKIFNDMYRFYLTAESEVIECIATGFNQGNYTKLESFIRFGDRMHRSIGRVYALLMNVRQSLLTNDWSYTKFFLDRLVNYENLLDMNYQDNRDFISEWKLGTFDEPLDELKQMTNNVNVADVKLWALQYLVAYTNDPQHFKLFNKAMGSHKAATAFDKLLLQYYLNVFKLSQSSTKKPEVESCLNYLNKNLNSTKIAATMPKDVLSGELNQNLYRFVEFTKLVGMLLKRKPNDAVKKLIDSTLADLRKQNWTQQQLAALNDIKKELAPEHRKTVEVLAKTIEKSAPSLH